jgi:hypothetical protein
MRFQKGVSGNPGGRAKIEGPLRDLARQYTTEAIQTLVTVMKDETAPHNARCIAAQALLDRGYGKPVQAQEVTLRKTGVTELSDSELMAVAAGADDEIQIEEDEPTAH